MAFTEMTDDVNIISKYPDEPYEDEGFTSSAFKASFDKAGKLCKAALNRLVGELNNVAGAGSLGFKPTADIPKSTVQEAVEYTKASLDTALTNLRTYLLGQMQEMTQGSVADSSIDDKKLASPAVKEPNLYDDSVTEPKIKDDSVTEPKIKNGSVTENKIDDGAVTERHLDSALKAKVMAADYSSEAETFSYVTAAAQSAVSIGELTVHVYEKRAEFYARLDATSGYDGNLTLYLYLGSASRLPIGPFPAYVIDGEDKSVSMKTLAARGENFVEVDVGSVATAQGDTLYVSGSWMFG
jgi:hypothetical protein